MENKVVRDVHPPDQTTIEKNMGLNNIFVNFENSLPEFLCDDIVELFEKEKNKKLLSTDCFTETKEIYYSEFLIPKNNETWEKIEKSLYKELLTKVYNYKQNLISNLITERDMEIILLLNNTLFLKDFAIKKYDKVNENIKVKSYRLHNRYKLLYFIYYLNDVSDGGELFLKNTNISIKSNIGNLLLFYNKLDFEISLPLSDDQYIISGELCYENKNI